MLITLTGDKSVEAVNGCTVGTVGDSKPAKNMEKLKLSLKSMDDVSTIS